MLKFQGGGAESATSCVHRSTCKLLILKPSHYHRFNIILHQHPISRSVHHDARGGPPRHRLQSRRLMVPFPERLSHLQSRCLATVATPPHILVGPELKSSAVASKGVRTVLKNWQEELRLKNDLKRQEFLEDTRDPGDFIAKEVHQHLAPKSELPLNFLGDLKHRGRLNRDFSRVGDLRVSVEDGSPICEVLVARLNPQSSLYYTLEGTFTLGSRNTTRFISFSDQVDPKDITPLLPYIPWRDSSLQQLEELNHFPIPPDAGVELRAHLNSIRASIEETYQEFSERISSAWDLVAHKNQTRYLTYEELAAEVFQASREALSVVQMAALFCYRMLPHSPFALVSLSKSPALITKFDGNVVVASREQMTTIEQVLKWYREYRASDTVQKRASSIIGRFATWARTVIMQSRQNRFPIAKGSVGPHGRQPVKGAFSETKDLIDADLIVAHASSESNANYYPPCLEHLTIIEYLQSQAAGKRENVGVMDADQNILAAIVHEIGMYGDEALDSAKTVTFLMELGLTAPTPAPSLIDQHWQESYVAAASGVQIQEAELLAGAEDNFKHMRHDWGYLDVLCIDDFGTNVVDDGISLEPIPNEHGNYWVHIHVANPSAFMSPLHPVANAAANRIVSTYLPAFSEPMISNTITDRWSLQKNNNVLTFSSKVTLLGEILETRIRPGLIHHVTRVTNETVESIINPSSARFVTLNQYVVGDPTIIKQPSEEGFVSAPHLSDLQRSTLRTLHEIAEAITKARQPSLDSLFEGTYPRSSLRVYGAKYESHRHGQAMHSLKDPTIVLRQTTTRHMAGSEVLHGDFSNRMVHTFMTLAYEIAGSYCSERNIPVPYMITTPDPSLRTVESYYHNFMQSIPDDQAATRQLAVTTGSTWAPSSLKSTNPGRDEIRGLVSPTQVTSPLRRYSDLLAHWQISSALRLEASAHDQPIRFKHNDKRLPFTHDNVAQLIPRIERHQAYWKSRARDEQKQWLDLFLQRAVQFGEEPNFPKEVEVLVMSSSDPRRSGVRCLVLELGLMRKINHATGTLPGEGFRIGERWSARWSLDLGNPQLVAIRRLGREQAHGFVPDTDPEVAESRDDKYL